MIVFPHQFQFYIHLFQEKETEDKGWKEKADLNKQDQDRETEEKLKCFQEIQVLEERIQKLHGGKENRQLETRKYTIEY